MRKSQKFFLLILGLIVVFGIYGCHQLSQLARSVRQNQKEILSQVRAAPLLPKSAESSPAKSEVSVSSGASATNPPSSAENSPAPVQVEYSLSEWMEAREREPIINICQGLDPSNENSEVLRSYSGSAFQNFYEKIMSGAVGFAPIYFRLRLPINRQVMLAVNDEPSLLKDIEFSIQLYQAKQELEDNLALARNIQTRAYYAWVLTRLALKDPNLIGNQTAIDLCSRLQDVDLNSDELVSSEEISAEIYDLMERIQIKPEEFSFNPNFQSQVMVLWGKEGFGYTFGLSVPLQR